MAMVATMFEERCETRECHSALRLEIQIQVWLYGACMFTGGDNMLCTSRHCLG